MTDVANFSRRRILQLSLGVIASVSLWACSPPTDGASQSSKTQSIKTGRLTIDEIKAPIDAKAYTSYKAPQNRFDVETFTFKGQERQYHAYKPPRRPRAVLLMLHGSNRNGASLVDKWQKLANQHSILLVAPDSADKRQWSSRKDSAAFMAAVLEHAKDAYNVDGVPTYGFGHSAGAIMMTRLSITEPEMFSAIAVHAGYLSPSDAAKSKRFKSEKVPLAHFLGSEDHIFGVEQAEQSAQTLADYGQDVELIIIDGHTHWYYDIAPFVNDKAWRFLKGYG